MPRCTALLLALTLAAAAPADEATLPDGRRLEGKLNADAGRLTFETKDRVLPLAGLAHVRFYGEQPASVRPLPFRIALVDGSTFAIDLLSLEAARLRVRTAWARELGVARDAVVSVTHSEGITPAGHFAFDPALDGVELRNGDQLFGTVIDADGEAVNLKVRTTSRKLPWGELRGVFPARKPLEPRATDGEHVRLWARSGNEIDELEGVLRWLDERRATLTQPLLGELQVERSLLVRLRGHFHGRRVEIDNASHHLGDPDRLSATLVPRRAEGTTLRRTVRLAEAPTAARLRLTVSELRTDGEGRLELHVNGKLVADLAARVDHGVKEPRRLDVEIPARLLHEGGNELELRLTPLRDSERHPSCGVSRIELELPR